MSTIAGTETFLSRMTKESTTDSFVSYCLSGSMTEWQGVEIRYGEVKRKNQPTTKSRPRILRRLYGFLIEFQGPSARVGFLQGGQVIQYQLPAEQLRRSDITLRNQPFQMDEVEITSDAGNVIVGYSFQSLAKPSDAYNDTLELDAERKRKRDLIFQRFAKAEG